jgi:ferritin-like metal-binding protein YciE
MDAVVDERVAHAANVSSPLPESDAGAKCAHVSTLRSGFSHLCNGRQNVIAWRGNMSVGSLEELFLDELKDLYSAEKQITKALPKMVKAATSPNLKEALQNHLEETNNQIQRLETIFEKLGKKGTGKTCEGMKGVLAEGAEVMQELKKGEVRDSGMITAAQRVEHYEMAGYGGVREFAKLLGQKEIMNLLDETLKEEEAADKKLTQVAKEVNSAALSAAPVRKAS